MKTKLLFLSLLLSAHIFATDNEDLNVEKKGLSIEVVDFEDGDKLKLFEINTGDHVLSKSYSQVDLSQLPEGTYLLEDNHGKSIQIDKKADALYIDESLVSYQEKVEFVTDAEFATEEEIATMHRELGKSSGEAGRFLEVQRIGNIIKVLNFETGDKLKLFQIKDNTHILTKTIDTIDLSDLPHGSYLLENKKGLTAIIEN